MYASYGDEIVESRTWSSGVEIVARVNWSHVARVRRALGVVGEEFQLREIGRSAVVERRTQRSIMRLARAGSRAA
jgi:hypothetical protein